MRQVTEILPFHSKLCVAARNFPFSKSNETTELTGKICRESVEMYELCVGTKLKSRS